MLSFENAYYLIGLAVIIPLVLLFVSTIYWKRKVRKALGDETLIDELTKSYSKRLFTTKFIVVTAAFVFGIFALANLHKPFSGNNEKGAGIDVMIALDVSKSMLSQDVKPSRLDKAKQCISMMIDKLGNNRVGLVVFAGQGFLQMPLTEDITEAKMYLSNATPDAVAVQGTNITSALQLCASSLDTKDKKHKAVVLISDGEDHDKRIVETLQELFDNGVVVYTVGIGTAAGSPIIEAGNVYKTDINGQTVISKLNDEELKNIAAKTEGGYYYLDNSLNTANNIAAQLNGMDKKLIEGSGGNKQYTSFFPWFIGVMILLLVIEIFIPEVKKKRFYATD